MKQQLVFILTVILLIITGLLSAQSSGEQYSGEGERWDILMAAEAEIWWPLLTNYYYADKIKFWPERKRALNNIINKYPESRWADDAALFIACGKASFENNINGAITDLKKIINKYPDGKTIISDWFPDMGCVIDQVWQDWFGAIISLNKDGGIRSTNMLGQNGVLQQREVEAVAYFAQLENCPRATKIMAQLILSKLLTRKGNVSVAAAILSKIIDDSDTYFHMINIADRTAAKRTSGFYVWRLVNRPEYNAFLSLVAYYETQKQIDKASATAKELIDKYSSDGFLWSINDFVGDFYKRNGLKIEADEQYQLALNGLAQQKDFMTTRAQLVDGNDFPDDYWENIRSKIAAKMNK